MGTSISSPLGTDLKNLYVRSYIFTIDSSGHVLSEWKSNRNEETGVTGLHFIKEDSSWVYLTRTFEVINPDDPDGWVSRGRIIKRDKNFYPVWDRSIGNPTSHLNYLSDLEMNTYRNWITAGQLVTSSAKPASQWIIGYNL